MLISRNGKLLLVGLSLLYSLGSMSPVAADDTSTAPADQASSKTLKGGVVEIQVTLNDLQDARLSISRVRKATANLYDEVTRQNVSMVMTPNMVGSMVIMTPRPQVSGGFLPPRKKWVDESMQDIGPIINLFKEDVDAANESNRRTDVSETAHKTLDPLREDAFKAVQTSFDIFKQLEGLTASGSYDNNAIASAANSLDAQMKQLDKAMKNGIKILQKEAKDAKKNKMASKGNTK